MVAARAVGRPSKLAPAVVGRFLELVAQGVAIEAAAGAAGVGESTVYRWLSRGREEGATAEFREFREAVERARAQAETTFTLRLAEHAERGDTRALLALLRRVAPQRWSERAELDVRLAGRLDAPIVERSEPWSPDAAFSRRVLAILGEAGALPDGKDPEP